MLAWTLILLIRWRYLSTSAFHFSTRIIIPVKGCDGYWLPPPVQFVLLVCVQPVMAVVFILQDS